MRKKPYQYKSSKIISVTSLALVLLFGATGCASSHKSDTTETITTPITPIVTEEVQPTETPTPIPMTPAPGVSEIPKNEEEEKPEIKLLTSEEAQKKVEEKVDLKLYRVEQKQDKVFIEGRAYFEFHVYSGEKIIEPAILVDCENGVLYYYDADKVMSAFSKFPVESVTTPTDGATVTTDDALVLLKTLSKESLSLSKDIVEYNISADEWTTMVNGDNCYCFNVYEKEDQLVGKYYVSTKGNSIYSYDEDLGDFKKIN